MNNFRFIHTGDWHLGRPFAGFNQVIAERLRQARRDSLVACADAARRFGGRHILVAGDVFDTRDVNRETWQSALTLMARASDLSWHIIPGNHDYHQPGDVWDLIRQSAPATVRVHLRPEVVEIEDGVWLLPSPLVSRVQARDPTAWMAAAETPAGALRIGLAHGSIDGVGGDAANVPIAVDAASRGRLDYLALGDWHGTKQIDARTWYAGTPEPERYLDNASGQVLAVTIRPGEPPSVEAVGTARHHWLSETAADGEPLDAAVRLMERVDALGSDTSQAIARLRVSGRVSLAEDQALRRTMENISALVMVTVLDDREMRVSVGPAADINTLLDPTLRPIADRLSAEIARGEIGGADDTRVASEALRLLTLYADVSAQAAPPREEA